jgi:hypothetical protein
MYLVFCVGISSRIIQVLDTVRDTKNRPIHFLVFRPALSLLRRSKTTCHSNVTKAMTPIEFPVEADLLFK